MEAVIQDFSRDWRCPYCGGELTVTYKAKNKYAVTCREKYRSQIITAKTPEEAASRVGIPVRHYDDWDEDDGPALWWDMPIIEQPPLYVGTPLDDDFQHNGRPTADDYDTDVPQEWWWLPIAHPSQLYREDAIQEYNNIAFGPALGYQNFTNEDYEEYIRDNEED